MQFRVSSILRQASLLLLLAVPAALLTAFFHPRAPIWEEDVLQPGEVRLEMVGEWQDVLWVDARTRSEYEEGHIPEAVLLNEEAWDELLFDFFEAYIQNPNQRIVVYCGGSQCERSTIVAERLRENIEDADIFVLKGDWREWNRPK